MRFFALTMGYNRIEIIRKSLTAFYERQGARPEKHFLMVQHYPLPSREEHRAELLKVASDFGLKVVDTGRNEGYHNAQNHIINTYCTEPGDYLINFDPDSMPLDDRWIDAIQDAFVQDPKLAVVALTNPCIANELRERGCTVRDFPSGLQIAYPKIAGVLSLVAWDCSFVRQVGGLKEPRRLYGGIEAWMWTDVVRLGRTWGYLTQYRESTELGALQDPDYGEWKLQHGHYGTFAGDFDDFLRMKGRIT